MNRIIIKSKNNRFFYYESSLSLSIIKFVKYLHGIDNFNDLIVQDEEEQREYIENILCLIRDYEGRSDQISGVEKINGDKQKPLIYPDEGNFVYWDIMLDSIYMVMFSKDRNEILKELPDCFKNKKNLKVFDFSPRGLCDCWFNIVNENIFLNKDEMFFWGRAVLNSNSKIKSMAGILNVVNPKVLKEKEYIEIKNTIKNINDCNVLGGKQKTKKAGKRIFL